MQSTDLDGQIEHYGPLTVLVETGTGGGGEIPQVTALKSPYPNPFNPDLNIVYDLSETTNVQIHIYNSKGQLVKTLVDRQETAKSYRILWDGKDDSGRLVSSGAYFIKMSAGSYTKTTKAIMLK
ncbi:MAG: FlgD immunoglobulin-like domain containing protein [Candidatus Cloacimonetes bacterium]|nr:FlgD immunoglobulin-like domain containing protein [Candidatus Cloacimonadota bacterium]